MPGTDDSTNNPACPIRLVYRRAAGDGRAGQGMGAEQANPCQALIPLLPAGWPAIGRPVCTTDILSVAILPNVLSAGRRSAAPRSANFGLHKFRLQRRRTRCPSYKERSRPAGWPEEPIQANPCQVQIVLSTDFRRARDGQDVRRTREDSPRTTPVSDFLVYRRAAGDGRAAPKSTPQAQIAGCGRAINAASANRGLRPGQHFRIGDQRRIILVYQRAMLDGPEAGTDPASGMERCR